MIQHKKEIFHQINMNTIYLIYIKICDFNNFFNNQSSLQPELLLSLLSFLFFVSYSLLYAIIYDK